MSAVTLRLSEGDVNFIAFLLDVNRQDYQKRLNQAREVGRASLQGVFGAEVRECDQLYLDTLEAHIGLYDRLLQAIRYAVEEDGAIQ